MMRKVACHSIGVSLNMSLSSTRPRERADADRVRDEHGPEPEREGGVDDEESKYMPGRSASSSRIPATRALRKLFTSQAKNGTTTGWKCTPSVATPVPINPVNQWVISAARSLAPPRRQCWRSRSPIQARILAADRAAQIAFWYAAPQGPLLAFGEAAQLEWLTALAAPEDGFGDGLGHALSLQIGSTNRLLGPV